MNSRKRRVVRTLNMCLCLCMHVCVIPMHRHTCMGIFRFTLMCLCSSSSSIILLCLNAVCVFVSQFPLIQNDVTVLFFFSFTPFVF